MAGTTRVDSAIGFRLMALMYRIRDLLQDPRRILEMAKLEEGMNVADYGCGPGSFAICAAQIVGDGGMAVQPPLDRGPCRCSSWRFLF